MACKLETTDTMTMSRPPLGSFFALLSALAQIEAQTARPQLSAAQAQQFEATLAGNPNDRAARGALLDYYFLNPRLDSAQSIPARRRHILWLIQNSPSDTLAGGPAATIDPTGHRLADAEGFKIVSDAWRSRAAGGGVVAGALANAAYFFKLSDKALTISLLERALTLEPANREFSARLGDEYAMAIMGVTMVNKNGYPLRTDPRQTQSALAMQAREALTNSQNPYALAKAGYMLTFQGVILRNAGQLAFDTAPLAEAALQRAVSLASGDPGVASYLAQHRAIQREIQASGR